MLFNSDAGAEASPARLVEQRLVRALQLGGVVDAERLGGVGEDVDDDPPAVLPRHAGDVGEVDLALGVVRPPAQQLREAREDVRRRQRVEAGVDGVHRQLPRRRVARLDDAQEAAVVVAKHPPQGAGMRHLGHRQGAPGAVRLGRLGEGDEGLRAHQRHVAGEHQHGGLAAHPGCRLGEGVAGAALLGLEGEGDVRRRHRGAHRVGAVAHHHHDLGAAGGAGGVEHPGHQRPAGRRVQHLGQLGAHARALAGGEHDGHPRPAGGARRRRRHDASRCKRPRVARASLSGSWRIRSPPASRSRSTSSTPAAAKASRSTATGTEPLSA